MRWSNVHSVNKRPGAILALRIRLLVQTEGLYFTATKRYVAKTLDRVYTANMLKATSWIQHVASNLCCFQHVDSVNATLRVTG